MRMKNDVKTIFKFSGFLFMLVSTILFYQSLYVAANNPGFFVIVYFDHFGEGLIELILFTAFIPIILYTIAVEVREVFYWRK